MQTQQDRSQTAPLEIRDLPSGNRPRPLTFPHFPSLWQAVLWRNWGIVPEANIAAVLQCSVSVLRQDAAAMGLEPRPQINPKWLTHGYLTIIRSNWHLLPYEQLLQLLEWTPERLAYTLKEEDFCWIKLGKHKPECPKVIRQELSSQQKEDTLRLKQTLQHCFSPEEMAYDDQPFAFLERFAPIAKPTGKPKFETNFIHSYCAGCGDVLGNADIADPVPENLLSQYASMGIKGVWMHAQLYMLYPIPGAEEFSPGCEKRLANLKRIIASCAKYGLKVYLYLNEPRGMVLPFYEKKPLWAGFEIPQKNTKTICTTRTPEPLMWLESSMKSLFTDARGLGGIFCITMSENATGCHCTAQHEKCPYCAKENPAKLLAGIINAMERGMHAAAPEADMIAFDWAWAPDTSGEGKAEFKKEVMDLLPETVIIQSVSEWGMITEIGGVKQYLRDYSISQVGPSQESLEVWEHARKTGKKVIAKVQINNSWELSAIPFLPVPYLVQEHLDNLKKAGVSGLMLSWTLGGFPGGNLELLNASPEEIAAAKYHPELAKEVCKAWKFFSESFREFPFHIQVLYKAPMNYGPMNLLHLEPTGYPATMVGFPYDDLNAWRGVYPEEILEQQFRKLTDGWKNGLEVLKKAQTMVHPEENAEFHDLYTLAEAGYCHFYSTYLQIRFVRLRNSKAAPEKLSECVREELKNVRRFYDLVRRDSRIGFEASNHYYYTLNDLREKIISCAYILKRIAPSMKPEDF